MAVEAEINQKAIAKALSRFGRTDAKSAAQELLARLGYSSSKTIKMDGSVASFLSQIDPDGRLTREKSSAEVSLWKHANFIFQLTNDELPMLAQGDQSLFESDTKYHRSIIESFVFLSIELRDQHWTRGQLASITRELNTLFPMPAIIFFRYGNKITLSLIPRRTNKKDSSRDVVEATSKVSLIKDIDIEKPHRAHINILADLHIRSGKKAPSNFTDLYIAWTEILSVEELNKKFYQKLSNWYLWSIGQVQFPIASHAQDPKESEKYNQIAVIRLLTRLIFVWFIKEKGLVPDKLFSKLEIGKILKNDPENHPHESNYYKAILQNLFFATLNSEGNGKRNWRSRGSGGQTSDYMVATKYRFKEEFNDSNAALKLFDEVPFLNGGLFECLDKELTPEELFRNPHAESLASREGSHLVIRTDGFSERKDNILKVPNEIFFGREMSADLNEEYGTKNKPYSVDGLLNIFESYKFTVEENTPFEEEVALDPELLGKVFENLIASYNEDTSTTARKKSGSFYTPRVVVDYMVDEALVGHLQQVLDTSEKLSDKAGESNLEVKRLRNLLDYSDNTHDFSDGEVERLIASIESIRAIDPACGSGAFLMGLLQKLVHVLRSLDPQNKIWRERNEAPLRDMLTKAKEIPDPNIKAEKITQAERALKRLEKDFSNVNYPDYARKLYLIDKTIHGTDIQPIAVQIAKLRVFISLIVSQKIDPKENNLNITPLPNLETRIVAANAILPLEKEKQEDLFRDESISLLEGRLRDSNERHFSARTRKTKLKIRRQISELRQELSERLQHTHGITEQVAKQIARWDPFDQNTAANFFDPEWMFGRAEKFNIVVANPPYIRQEKINKLEKIWLKETHLKLKKNKGKRSKFLPNGLYQSFTGTADYLVYFIERGIDLLEPGGMFVYITSNKWFRAKYGVGIRTWFGRVTQIRSIIDFGDANVFDAMAYPTIIVAQRRQRLEEQAKESDVLRAWHWPKELGKDDVHNFPELFQDHSFEVPQKSLDNQKGWQLEPAYKRELLNKIQLAGMPLNEYVSGKLYYGIKTGCNEAFVINNKTKDGLVKKDPSSAKIIKPFLRGKDIKRWHVQPENLWLIFTRQGIDIDAYPAIKEHLSSFRDRLEPKPKNWPTGKAWPGRKSGPYKWYEIQDKIAYWQEFEGPKIFVPAIQNNVHYAADLNVFYGNDKTNIIVSAEWKFLIGVLNSNVSWWFTQQTFSSKAGGFYEFKPMYLSTIPIPAASNLQKKCIESVVTIILSGGEVPIYEQLLNALTYELFFPDNLNPKNIHLFEACIQSGLQHIGTQSEAKLATASKEFIQKHLAPGTQIRTMLSDLQSLDVVRIVEARS